MFERWTPSMLLAAVLAIGALSGTGGRLGPTDAQASPSTSLAPSLGPSSAAVDHRPVPLLRGGAIWDLTAAGDRLFFVANADGRLRLWVSDGTPGSARRVRLCRSPLVCEGARVPTDIAAVGDLAIFWTYEGMWRSDGTTGGTYLLVRDVQDRRRRFEVAPPGRTYDHLCASAVIGVVLYALTSLDCMDPAPRQLWRTDGTRRGTWRLPGIDGGWHLLPAGDQLLVPNADERDRLWVTDGSRKATRPLRRIQLNWEPPAVLGSAILLRGDDGRRGSQLWVTDGTRRGTRPVRDIGAGRGQGSEPHALTTLGDRVVFIADDGEDGEQLWVSDGSAAGTHPVAGPLSNGHGERPVGISPLGRIAIVHALDVEGRPTLWRTNGTEAGTLRLAMLRTTPTTEDAAGGACPDDDGSTWPGAVAGGLLYTIADDDARACRLWRTDGTPEGTFALNVVAPARAAPGWLTAVGDRMYFAMRLPDETGARLWRTDGTDVGTAAIDGLAEPTDLTAVGDRLFLVARMEPDGTEGHPTAAPRASRRDQVALVAIGRASGTGREPSAPVPDDETSAAAHRSSLTESFPSEVGGAALQVAAYTGRQWLEAYYPDRPDDAAAIDEIEAFLTSLGASIEDLEIVTGMHRVRSRATAITAIRVRGATSAALRRAVIPFMFGDLVRTEVRTARIAGKTVTVVTDALVRDGYRHYAYVTGDVAWLVEAEEPQRSQILRALH